MINKELYLQSKFYEKYQDSYYSDCILKGFFKEDIKKHRVSGLNTYKAIFEKDVEIMQDFLNLFWFQLSADYKTDTDETAAFKMLYSFYIDPDGAAIKQLDNTICSADGLISIRRLFLHEGLSRKFLDAYRIYRRFPVIFFPKERNGINMARATAFGDRIDHTLFDLKRYYESESKEQKRSCKLFKAYKKIETRQWLSDLGSFSALADWLNIKGLFTDENYNVLDLQKNDNSIITDYAPNYLRAWDDTYYNSVKKKIEIWNSHQHCV